MISTNHSTQPDHCSAGAGRDAWAIVVARRVGAEPVSRCARRSGPPRQCRALPSTRRTDSQPASKRPASSEGDRRAEEGSRALLGYVLQAATVARRPRRVPRVSYIRLAEVFRAPLLEVTSKIVDFALKYEPVRPRVDGSPPALPLHATNQHLAAWSHANWAHSRDEPVRSSRSCPRSAPHTPRSA